MARSAIEVGDLRDAIAPLETALLLDVLAVVGFGIAALGLGALTLRRRTA